MTTHSSPPPHDASGKKPTVDADKTILANLNQPFSDPGAPTRVSGMPDGSQTQMTQVPSGPATAATVTPAVRPATSNTILTDLNVEVDKSKVDQGTHRGQVWGDFEIGELLGKGGMGSVYKGRQISLDRAVAIKVLPSHLSQNENFRLRFALEAKAVAQISSPHVIQVYSAGQHQGHHYFVMEYVEGHDLARKLKSGFRPSFRQSLDLMVQAAHGIAAAGELGIIHRDIKPANMMVTAKQQVKLMDFGLVKLAASAESGLTMAGTIMGTVNYFSPEQGRGETCDQRTDIYALGVVFYELLTGKLPFTGADATSVIYQHIHQPPRLPKEIDPNIPEDYQAVVLKCMQKRPEDRYQTAAQLVTDLERLREGLRPQTAFVDPGVLRTGGTIVRNTEFRVEEQRRHRVVLIVGGIAAAALVLGVGVWLSTRAHPTTPPPSGPSVTTVAPTRATTAVVQVPDREQYRTAIEAHLAAGRFTEARASLSDGLSAHPGDDALKAQGKAIDQAEGQLALQAASAALDQGDYDRAGRNLTTASALVPDAPALKELSQRLSAHEGSDKQRRRQIDEARTLLQSGDARRAEDILARMAAAAPNDDEVAKELRLARKLREDNDARQQALHDQLANGQKALERRDLDAAQVAFTASLQHDPSSSLAKQGLTQVNQMMEERSTIQVRFHQALEQRDLAGAEAELAKLRALVPGSAAVVVAEQAMSNSKLAEDEQRKRTSENEAQFSAKSREVLAVINDPKQDIPAMEQALAAFVASAGSGRPEQRMLEEKIEDRRQLKRVAAGLAQLDAAMKRHDAAALAQVVADPVFSAELNELMTFSGLVYESRITDFVRTGHQGTVKVSLRHALDVFPETELHYLYDLREDANGWVIATAHLQP